MLRAPAPGKSYRFEVSQPSDFVADGRALTISGNLSHSDERIEVTLTVRPRRPFSTRHGSRSTYRLPTFLGFEAIPKFDLKGFDDPATTTRTGEPACGKDAIRHSTLLAEETLSAGRVDPSNRIDSISPPVTADILRWSTTDNEIPLSPIVSLVQRNTEQQQQRSLFVAGVLVGVAAAVAPIGLPLVARSRMPSSVADLVRRLRRSGRPPRS